MGEEISDEKDLALALGTIVTKHGNISLYCIRNEATCRLSLAVESLISDEPESSSTKSCPLYLKEKDHSETGQTTRKTY